MLKRRKIDKNYYPGLEFEKFLKDAGHNVYIRFKHEVEYYIKSRKLYEKTGRYLYNFEGHEEGDGWLLLDEQINSFKEVCDLALSKEYIIDMCFAWNIENENNDEYINWGNLNTNWARNVEEKKSKEG